MKISKIDHLGIGVESIDAVLPYFENVLGLKCYAIEEVADQKVKTAFLKVYALGMGNIEALHPLRQARQIQDARQAFDGACRLVDVVLPLQAFLF